MKVVSGIGMGVNILGLDLHPCSSSGHHIIIIRWPQQPHHLREVTKDGAW